MFGYDSNDGKEFKSGGIGLKQENETIMNDIE
jgi:hypothetical protein